jgi:hypothetical protein
MKTAPSAVSRTTRDSSPRMSSYVAMAPPTEREPVGEREHVRN